MTIHKFQGTRLRSFVVNTGVCSLPLSLLLWLLREETSALGRDPVPSSGEWPETVAKTWWVWGRLGHQSECKEIISLGRRIGQLSLECGGHQC